MKNKELLDTNSVLLKLDETLKTTALLTGGAVIDILEGRKPKDYDFIFNTNLDKALSNHGELQYVSNTSVTYKIHGVIVQLLYKSTEDFPYTIEQAKYNINNKSLIDFCDTSFNNKILIPTILKKSGFISSNFTAYDALIRVPHWGKKGYKLPEITYKSLLNKLADIKETREDS